MKRPSPSLTAVRTFSISAGLAAFTVTPGSTAPELSFTTPAILLDPVCAPAGADARTANAHARPIVQATIFRTMTPPRHLRSATARIGGCRAGTVGTNSQIPDTKRHNSNAE